MGTLEPIALSPREAAQFLSISKRTLSRLIARRKIVARKDGVRTLVDVASLKAYYEAFAAEIPSRAACVRVPSACRAVHASHGSPLTFQDRTESVWLLAGLCHVLRERKARVVIADTFCDSLTLLSSTPATWLLSRKRC
jgi:excisionase family DNA binding protein